MTWAEVFRFLVGAVLGAVIYQIGNRIWKRRKVIR